MPRDENEGPQPRFPDPGRDETRYRPPRPPADGLEEESRRGLECLPAIILIVLLIFLIVLALDLLGAIDILSR